MQPWFKFYAADYLLDDDVFEMPPEAGQLLVSTWCLCWRDGCAPADPDKLARAARLDKRYVRRHFETVARFFRVENGFMFSDRMENERSERRELSAKRAAVGARGAAAKWGPDSASAEASRQHHATRNDRMRAARERGTHTADEWGEMLAVFGYSCLRCGALASSGARIVKDHITPVYQGGSDAISNIQPLCSRCNQSKGPESTDYRKTDKRCLAKWMANSTGNVTACQSQSQSQNQIEEKSPSDSCAETAPKRRSTPDAPPDPLCPTFPCDGPVANWQATAAQVARWRELYPTLDLRHELLKAHTWIVDHPAKRKTARGMAGFITSWLGRATNQPRGFQPNPTLPAAPPKPPRVQTRRDLLAQEIRDAEAFKRTDRVAELRRRLAEAERNGTADEPIE